MRIRILIGLSILCVTFPLWADAQVRPVAASSDTARVNGIVLLDPGISLGRAVFLFPASGLSDLPFGDSFNPSPPGGWGPAGPFAGGLAEPRADLLSPLRLQMARDKLSPFQTALEAVQLGAVGYMAYRHVRKYGLFR
jgi:hypothetical protein